jgi:multicomponent Na+:H+ antiporter subunit D
MSLIHPSAFLLLGALLALLPKGIFRHFAVVAAPLLALASALNLSAGNLHFELGGLFDLNIYALTIWNKPFAVAFCMVSFLGLVYARPLDRRDEDCAALIYAAAAVGAVLAGDLFTFYCCWEILALSATILIFGGRTGKARRAAFRYLIYHIAGGLVLLFGILWRLSAGYQDNITEIGLDSPGGLLIFIGIGVNCAWPLLHTWLTDAYPEASVSGVLFLSAFTTKTAIYALLVFFPGTKALIVIGTLMAAFPIFYAVIENDLRRVLAYSLINQVGFMVVGVGIGTDLALNGAVCHAMTDLVFKGLLFMTVGACLYQTGYATATDLGGLFRKMPVSAVCCIVGAASISAFPGFSGFVSKSMITSAASSGEHPYTLVWLVLIFASAGVFHHAGIKIPFFAFFGHDSGHDVKEVPFAMQFSMIVSAIVCVVFGCFPEHTVYALLPLENTYVPYTADHVLAQTELLIYSALAFTLMLLAGVYPAEIRSKNLDFDYILEVVIGGIGKGLDAGLNGLNKFGDLVFLRWVPGKVSHFFGHAPARVSSWIYRIWYRLMGVDQERIDQHQQQYFERCKRNALPVGTSAIYALILLGVLALLQ